MKPIGKIPILNTNLTGLTQADDYLLTHFQPVACYKAVQLSQPIEEFSAVVRMTKILLFKIDAP